MKLAELISRTFRNGESLYVSLTQKCPLRCRHCFVESSPTRTERLDAETFRRWIREITERSTIQIFYFSGGEPFSHPRALRYALQACREAGRYGVVCTSAHWGRTLESACKVLDAYPPFECLWLSTDSYHEEFVPLAYLRNAVVAARKRGLDVVFQVVDEPDFLPRFEQEAGVDLVGRDQVYVAPLTNVGRAAKEVTPKLVQLRSHRSRLADVPDVPCPWLNTPWLREDGGVYACPQVEVRTSVHHPARLGCLDERSYSELSTRGEQDDYLRALRVFGPRWIAENLPVEAWGWRPDSLQGRSICDLCHSLARVPDLPARTRETLKAGGSAARMRALEFFIYGRAIRETGAPVGAAAAGVERGDEG